MTRFRERFLSDIFIFINTVSLLFALVFLLYNIENSLTEPAVINTFTVVYLFFTGFIHLVVLEIFTAEGASLIPQIFYCIIYSGISVAVCMLVKNSIPAAVAFLTSAFVYPFSKSTHNFFSCHIDFMEQCRNKCGNSLITELHNNYDNAENFVKRAKSLSQRFFLIDVFFALALYIFKNLQVKLSTGTIISFLCFALSTLGFIWFTRIFCSESYYAFIGKNSVFENRRKIIFYSIFICLIVLAAALEVSSDTALLSKDILKRLFHPFDWGETSSSGANILEGMTLAQENTINNDSAIYGVAASEAPFFKWLGLAIKIFFSSVIVIAVLIFLVRPFLSYKLKTFFEQNRLGKYLKAFFKNLKIFFHSLKYLFSKDKSSPGLSAEGAAFSKAIKERIGRAKKSKEKLKELDRITREFTKIIDWASEKKIKYTRNLAPLEFVELIISTASDLDSAVKENLISAAGLFEKSLYSASLLTQEEEQNYLSSINKIVL